VPRLLVVVVALCAAGLLSGCHTVRYQTERPASARHVEQKHHFFFWGLKGKPVVDLDAACPEGVSRWSNQATAADWLASVVTLGVWSPRTVVIECAEVSR
jgi:uncharacterized protein YceK